MHEHHRDRLRERFMENPNSLNEHELMELILFSAIPRKNTNDTAHRLIDRFGSVKDVLNASPHELMDIEGVGNNAAAFIVCLGKIINRQINDNRFPKVFDYNDIRQPLIEAFAGYSEEVFMAFFLDKKQNIQSRKIIYGKSAYKVDIDLKDFSRQIVLCKPAYVAVAHNHLSGYSQPSSDDDNATEKLCMVCALNGAALIDHIIVAGDKVYSYYYDHRLDIIRKKVEQKLS